MHHDPQFWVYVSFESSEGESHVSRLHGLSTSVDRPVPPLEARHPNMDARPTKTRRASLGARQHVDDPESHSTLACSPAAESRTAIKVARFEPTCDARLSGAAASPPSRRYAFYKATRDPSARPRLGWCSTSSCPGTQLPHLLPVQQTSRHTLPKPLR